ncbi:MAG: SAM-dependent methyltransferase [Kineosporiaceae bacterium]
MTATGATRYSPTWLELREPADARARSRDLGAAAAAAAWRTASRIAPQGAPLVVHDLGCGTGSMGRWLAPTLARPQHRVLHDHDPDQLRLAAAELPGHGTGAAPITVQVRPADVSTLQAGDLEGAALVTASALLDLLTREEVAALAAACAAGRCPALLTLSVVGTVELTPADPVDADVRAAFDAHQRRTVAGRRLLGPDAVDAASAAFARSGAQVDVRPSPWRLGPADSALVDAWLGGWVGAAAEQRPDLPAEAYLRRRRGQLVAGRLEAAVHHADLLARWP